MALFFSIQIERGFMDNYDEFRNCKKRVIDILTSKTSIKEMDSIPSNEDEFTYENGIKTWVGALFVDIRNSTDYFKKNKAEKNKSCYACLLQRNNINPSKR